MWSTAIASREVRVRGIAIMIALLVGVGAVVLEALLDAPARLPGHRALPGAFALLLLADAVPPLLLLAVSLAVPLVLSLAGLDPPAMVAVWLVSAALLIGLARTRLARSPWVHALVGLLFGALRYLTLPGAWHHAPEVARLGGHLAFGALAGLLAYGVDRAIARRLADRA